MVIDLTRRPVFINTDVCTDSVVIRTGKAKAVDGLLRRKLDKRAIYNGPRPPVIQSAGKGERKNGDFAEVIPAAEAMRGEVTFMEVRLPTRHVTRNNPKEPLPNPYEVATFYRDQFTGYTGTWRAQLIVERVKRGPGFVWLVTVRDESAGLDLVTATAKELDNIPEAQLEPLPLHRANLPGSTKTSVWDRLRATAAGFDEDP